jgi:hypothetical protein
MEGLTKAQEKELIARAFKSLRESAGPDSYIADIFNEELLSAISSDIDADVSFFTWREIRDVKEGYQKDNKKLATENTELKNVGEALRRANQDLSRELSKVKAAIADLYQFSKK